MDAEGYKNGKEEREEIRSFTAGAKLGHLKKKVEKRSTVAN